MNLSAIRSNHRKLVVLALLALLCAAGYLLVEVGGHGNTLGEAMAGARLWADNVARTLLGIKAEGSAG